MMTCFCISLLQFRQNVRVLDALIRALCVRLEQAFA